MQKNVIKQIKLGLLLVLLVFGNSSALGIQKSNHKIKANPHCGKIKDEEKMMNASLDLLKKQGAAINQEGISLNKAIANYSDQCQKTNSKVCNRQMIDFIGQQKMSVDAKKNSLDASLISLAGQKKDLEIRKDKCKTL